MMSDGSLSTALKEVEEAREEALKPSFLVTLFEGRPNFSLIYPYPEQPPADKLIGDEFLRRVEEFLRTKVDPAAIERGARIPSAVIQGLRELGCLRMKIPEEYGGLGFSQTNYGRVLSLIGSYCDVIALMLSVHQSIGLSEPLLVATQGELGKALSAEARQRLLEQQRAYLPRLAQKDIAAFALTEPGVGSDPASMSIEAVLSEDGTHYVVSGEKLWITNAPIAGLLALMARVPSQKVAGADGIKRYLPVPGGKGATDSVVTAFVVEMDTPGVTVAHRCQFEGCSGVENAYLRFENVCLPKDNIIGEVGYGLKYALTALNAGRIAIAPICLGMAKQSWLPTLEWARTRRTFGKSIGEHKAQTVRIAGMAADLFAMEAVTWLVAAMSDHADTDIRIEAAVAKVFTSEANIRFQNNAQILWGGRGYETADSKRARGESAFPIEQLVRDAPMYRIGEGATDVLIPFIARETWDPHLKRAREVLEHGLLTSPGRQEALRLLAFYGRWYADTFTHRTALVGMMPLDGKAAKYLRYVEEDSRRMARDFMRLAFPVVLRTLREKLASTVGSHGFPGLLTGLDAADIVSEVIGRLSAYLQEEQVLVARFVCRAMDLFVITATASYAECLEKRFGRTEAWDLVDQFFRDARKRIEGKGLGYRDGLTDNDDDETAAVGRSALARRYDWLAEGSVIRTY